MVAALSAKLEEHERRRPQVQHVAELLMAWRDGASGSSARRACSQVWIRRRCGSAGPDRGWRRCTSAAATGPHTAEDSGRKGKRRPSALRGTTLRGEAAPPENCGR